MVPPVRVVLCDLDDTLFDHRRATQSALAAVHTVDAALGRWSRDELDRRHRVQLDALHLDVLRGRYSIDDARVERFRRLLAAAAGDASASRAAEIARFYRAAYEQASGPVAGAVALAAAIKRAGLRLVIVTNNLAAEQRQKLDRCSLTPYVDVLVASDEAGVTKPARGIFHAALDRVGATVGEAVMVGDDWATDIAGARGVGLRAVWLNRFDEVSPDSSIPELRALEPTAAALRTIVRHGAV